MPSHHYDIFISYRRNGGYETARHLYDLLVRDGYSVSFDQDNLMNGNFNEALSKRVAECKDFMTYRSCIKSRICVSDMQNVNPGLVVVYRS